MLFPRIFAIIFLTLSLSVGSSAFAYNPKDPIGWQQANPLPSTVVTNGRTYVTTFTFKNQTGYTLVHALQIQKTSTPAAEFTYTDNCSGQLLTNGATCTVTAYLTPVTDGQKNVQLVIAGWSKSHVPVPQPPNTATASGASSVSITGSFTTPASWATSSPASVSLGQSQPFTVTYTNRGAAPAIGITTSCSSNTTSCTSTCGSSLSTGVPCSISGNFTPSSASPSTQTVSTTLNYSGSSGVTVSANVPITTPTTVIGSVSPSAVTLASTQTSPFTFTFTNYTSSPVVVGSSGFTLGGTGSAHFAYTPACGNGTSLSANGGSCSVTGTYTAPSSFTGSETLIGTLDVTGSPSATAVITASATPSAYYIMWTLPSTGISYPVYVYQGGEQVNYIPTSATQAFLGGYPAGVESKTFSLYYLQSGSTYRTCNVAFTSSGTLNTGSTTCSGAVINPPHPDSSNVYTLAVAASAFPSTGGAPSPAPAVPDYSERGIVLENNTGYQAIRVQGSYSGGNYTQIIENGTSVTFPVGASALTSSAFYVTAYCTAGSFATCCPPPGGASTCNSQIPTPPNTSSNWIVTGGYNGDNNSHPYATKVELTFHSVSNGIPGGASNVDVSGVDGFNMAVQFYPVSTGNSGPNTLTASNSYCTYTVPPEGSTALGAGLYVYDPGTPSNNIALAQIFKASVVSGNLSTLCVNSSQLPSGYSGSDSPWALSVNSFTGCMSPCTYALKTYGAGSDNANRFCCEGPYNTPETCDVASGQVGANTSTYVENVDANFQNVYPFAYGDAGSDYSCEADKSYVVNFVTSNGITPPP